MGSPSLESGKHKDRFSNPLPQEVSREPVWELQDCFAWIYVCKTVAFNSFSNRRSFQGCAERGIRISSLFHLDTVIIPIGTLNVLTMHNKRAVFTVLEWLNWTLACMTLFQTISISGGVPSQSLTGLRMWWMPRGVILRTGTFQDALDPNVIHTEIDCSFCTSGKIIGNQKFDIQKQEHLRCRYSTAELKCKTWSNRRI